MDDQIPGVLAVPDDCWHWGVDLRVGKVVWAAVKGSRGLLAPVVAPQMPGARRLAWWHAHASDAVLRFAEQAPPASVWVEAPGGRHVHPALMHLTGVVLAATYGALSGLYGWPVAVELIPVATWKKEAVGFGGASKDDVLRWARGRGYQGGDFDEADAFGVATAGALRVRWEPAA